MPRDVEELASRMTRLLSSRGQLNRHAQAHARAILVQLETPSDTWPHFNPDLDDRIHYTAHLMIVSGLELVDHDAYSELAHNLLVQGAESLEFMAEALQDDEAPNALLTAAISYHIAGHHARAYVLAQRLLTGERYRDTLTSLLLALLTRDLSSLVAHTLAILSSDTSGDGRAAEALRQGTLDDDDAIASLGRQSIAHAVALYVEYLKRGTPELVDQACERCRNVAALGRDARHVDLWWLGRAAEKLLRHLGNSSLWNGLRDMGPPNAPFSQTIRRYVESNLSRKPANISLWPSQIKALPIIKVADAPSFCVRMPTSAGKTKIAELTILRAFLDSIADLNAKYLYIAPFRSLAVEIESTLGSGLRPIGLRVSELYGGFDLTASDERLIQETQVLIATPEKFDAVIRLAPQLLEHVRLIIVDEGHIAGELSERGMRAEFLINRLLWKLGRTACRHVFISAVLPNPAEFARWIAGDESHVVTSQWRPSRLMFGECRWNGTYVRAGFTHEGNTQLQQEVFVEQFVASQDVRGLPGVGRRRNRFPHGAPEAFAATVARFALYGTTLAFIPQARYVESSAKAIVAALAIMRDLGNRDRQPLAFPPPDTDSSLFRECLATIAEELGEGSEIATLLTAGIAVHHGSLPARTKVSIERLVRSGQVRIIVATTTLGQGVNLPIRTIIVRGLQQGQHDTVSPMSFWNIAGRAGRARCENEGQVLFFNDLTRPRNVVRRQRRLVASFIDRTAIVDVVGLLHRAISFLRDRWALVAPQIAFEDLCLKLAEDDVDWVDEDHRADFRSIVALIDQHLLALSVEGEFGVDEPDKLQEMLRHSLLFAQLEYRAIPDIDQDRARTILMSRLASVYRRIPVSSRRSLYYRMGFSISDCEKVVVARDELLETVQSMAEWGALDHSARIDLLLRLAGIAMRLEACVPQDKPAPSNALDILRAWLSGERAVDMSQRGLGANFDNNPAALGRFIEEFCVYGLAWAVMGLVGFAKHVLEAEGAELPSVADHIPAMFKMGVADPLAAILAPYLQQDRALASAVAAVCPYGLDEVNRAVAWVNSVTPEELVEAGVGEELAQAIAAKRRTLGIPDLDPASEIDWYLPIQPEIATACTPGDPVLVRMRPDRGPSSFDILGTHGQALGSFRLRTTEPPAWLSLTHRVQATIQEISEGTEGNCRLHLTIRLLGA